MLMLFLALAFLYGLMLLMTALIKDRPGAGVEKQAAGNKEQRTEDEKRRAAVIAVALARAGQELDMIGLPEAGEGLSPWQQYHRHRLLSAKLRTRTGR